jgi:NAD(P)-dependent dehydrogenase (short-subunit alcohol dehydrogenase family)
MMAYSFDGKVVIITGAASGIGRATAIKLASLSASLALTDLNAASLEETSARCDGSKTFTRTFDVASTEHSTQFITDAFHHFGRIDHVFNCAGVNPTSYALEDVSDEYWDKLVNTNLKGVFNVTRAAIPVLKSGASFVNVSSISGLHPTAGHAVYCATKYGVIGFSKCMALELGPKGIRVNVVAPGYINTPTNASVVAGPDAMERSSKGVAMGRMGSAEEVADVVAFLFSDESRYMNGSVVEVNGGIG